MVPGTDEDHRGPEIRRDNLVCFRCRGTYLAADDDYENKQELEVQKKFATERYIDAHRFEYWRRWMDFAREGKLTRGVVDEDTKGDSSVLRSWLVVDHRLGPPAAEMGC
jgi:hypothetical protein